MCSFSRYALPLLSTMLVIVLSVHFGMTLMYLAPFNPILLRIAPVVEGYMTPWFAQDWRLFAPDPINETRMLLVACRVRQTNGSTVETAWADVSTPLWEAQARQRFSSSALLIRPQMQAVQLYFDPGKVLPALERHRTVEDSEVNQLTDAIRAEWGARRILATRVLTRLSAAYCDRWYGVGQTVATRAGLAVLRFPRFSQRQLPDADGKWRFYPFAWMPYERVSSLSGTAK
jgi:hypothetical protein